MSQNKVILPTDPKLRKECPITTGLLDYFPLAVAEVAKVSKVGNDQHNPGQPMHWDREKSNDHADCIPRHLIDRGKLDTDGQRHSAKLAWRALANLELELEAAKPEEEEAVPPTYKEYRFKNSRTCFWRVYEDGSISVHFFYDGKCFSAKSVYEEETLKTDQRFESFNWSEGCK